MHIHLVEEPIASLAGQAHISIAFEVDRVLDVKAQPDNPNLFILTERPLATSYVKNYDAIEGQHPTQWPIRFDTSSWALFAAHSAGRRVGGAVIAPPAPPLTSPPDPATVAVLWDIRVVPELRGKGIGSHLFRAAESWAQAKSCTHLQAETQNINVPAARFYAKHGCELHQIVPLAYPHLPDEVQLLWRKNLFPKSLSPIPLQSP